MASQKAQVYDELAAMVWFLFVIGIAIVGMTSMFYPLWWDHPMLLGLYLSAVVVAFLTWMLRIIDLRSITD
jgi:membrane protein DedA with SNARE-associated domain